jgi:hypothetical protein
LFAPDKIGLEGDFEIISILCMPHNKAPIVRQGAMGPPDGIEYLQKALNQAIYCSVSCRVIICRTRAPRRQAEHVQ